VQKGNGLNAGIGFVIAGLICIALWFVIISIGIVKV
jgi:hypothetical protein